MMTMIDELARENLIPDGLIDFTVPVIDNFGDMGVSLSLALEILSQYPNLKIRFFSEDENLFKKLIGRDHPLMRSWHQEYRIGERLSYHTLSEYSKIAWLHRYNFFAYPIPQDGLPGVRSIVNFDYLQLSQKATSLHKTQYLAGNTEVTHFVPGYIEGLGGLTLPPRFHLSKESLSQHLGIPLYKKICTVFIYESTIPEILPLLEMHSDWHFLICGYIGDSLEKYSHIQCIPFIPMIVFGEMVQHADANIIRGEHSFAMALQSKKPFLWDIYKESNGAHIEKIREAEENLGKKIECTWENIERLLESSA